MSTSKGTSSRSAHLTRRRLLLLGVLTGVGLSVRSVAEAAADDSGISHAADSIHQEPLISATPQRVYEALTKAELFNRLIQFSDAIKSMSLAPKPAEIDAQPGGAFSLYGGYISG